MNTHNLPDARPAFLASVDQLTALVERTTPTDLDRPTPCDDWTVRDLLAHLVGVENRIVHIAGGGTPDQMPAHVDGIADDGWATAWNDRLDGLREVVATTDANCMVVHPAGTMPWAVALGIYASELVTHAWDLARALGVDDTLNQQLAAGVLPPMKAALPAELRGAEIGIPFGPVVAVGSDATPYAELVGWLGRDPEWAAR